MWNKFDNNVDIFYPSLKVGVTNSNTKVEVFKKGDAIEPEYFGISSVGGYSKGASKSNKNTNSINPFDKYDVDIDQVEYWYCNDPVVFGTTNRTADFVSSTGYEVRNDDNGEVGGFFNRMSFPFFIRNAAMNVLLYDNSFMDLREDYPKVISSKGMSINFDEWGNIVSYTQVIPTSNKKIELPKEQIVYTKMNAVDSGLVGVSYVIPLKSYLEAKSSVENYTSEFFNRNGSPRLHYIIKTKNTELAKRMREKLKKMKPHEDIISNEDLEIKSTSQPITDMMFKEWLSYLNRLVIIGIGTPEIIAGFSEDSNKANSRIQLQGFKYRIKAIQTLLANVINTQIIPKYFPKSKAYIVFKDLDKEDSNLSAINRNKIAQTLAQYVKNGIMSPEEAKQIADYDLKNITSDMDVAE